MTVHSLGSSFFLFFFNLLRKVELKEMVLIYFLIPPVIKPGAVYYMYYEGILRGYTKYIKGNIPKHFSVKHWVTIPVGPQYSSGYRYMTSQAQN